jgi:hypothetical protein
MVSSGYIGEAFTVVGKANSQSFLPASGEDLDDDDLAVV